MPVVVNQGQRKQCKRLNHGGLKAKHYEFGRLRLFRHLLPLCSGYDNEFAMIIDVFAAGVGW